MSSIEFWLFCYALVLLQFVSLQELDDNCRTANAHQGRCVHIDSCPALRKIAYSTAVSKTEKEYLQTHICAPLKVCCKEPSENSSPQVSTTTEDLEEVTLNSVTASHLLPDERDCGLDNAGSRIIGGDITEKEQFRWTVALEYIQGRRPGVKCGGTLINTKYVVTAAHCVFRVAVEGLKLRLGEWDLNNNPDCEEIDDEDCNPDVLIASISRIIIHPDYRKQINDIALLRLTKALPESYTTHILPICMPSSEEMRRNLFADSNVSVVGWGKTELVMRSQFKMFAKLVTTSIEECAENLPNVKLSKKHICAKSASNTARDTCGGDSGGPLQIQLNGNYYLIGVVSFGPPCGRTLLPAVYTRITTYMDWILENIVD